MSVGAQTIQDILSNKRITAIPEDLHQAFLNYLEVEFQKANRKARTSSITPIISSDKDPRMIRLLQTLHLNGYKKITNEQVGNRERSMMVKQFELAIEEFAKRHGILKFLNRISILKYKLKKLMLSSMIEYRERKRRKMEKDRLREEMEYEEEQYYQTLVKYFEEQKKLLQLDPNAALKFIECSEKMVTKIIVLNSQLFDTLEQEGVYIPKHEKDNLNSVFLKLKAELKEIILTPNEIEDKWQNVTDKIENMFLHVENMYERVKKTIDPSNLKAFQALNHWCESIESDLVKFVEEVKETVTEKEEHTFTPFLETKRQADIGKRQKYSNGIDVRDADVDSSENARTKRVAETKIPTLKPPGAAGA